MRIKVLKAFRLKPYSKAYEVGREFQVSNELGKQLIEEGKVQAVKEKETASLKDLTGTKQTKSSRSKTEKDS